MFELLIHMEGDNADSKVTWVTFINFNIANKQTIPVVSTPSATLHLISLHGWFTKQ